MDLSDVRRHHMCVVLELLLDDGPRSRASIAQHTGLTKATVSTLVADLFDRGLASEIDTPRAGRVGRPAIDVAARGDHVGALGLQIDVDSVAACVVDLSGRIRALHRRHEANQEASSLEVIERVNRVARATLDEVAGLDIGCYGAALAVPGLVDPADGTLFVAPNLHWFDADLAALVPLLELGGFSTVRVDNEANLATLAELRFGAGRAVSSFVYVSGGVGIGAGVVVDGQLWRGAHGFAGELGHLVVDPQGPPCACGARGCLEAIVRRDRSTGRAATAAALAGALRSVVHLVDPEAIVLGGTFAEHGDEFLTQVGDQLRATTLGARWHPCEVLRATHGIDAAVVGAATTTLIDVMSDLTTVPAGTLSA